MTKIVFRKARRDDLPAIVALLADDIRGKGREDASVPLDPRYIAAFEAITVSGGNHLVVGEDGGHIVACAQLTVTPGMSYFGAARATVEGVRVAAGRRGQKIGEALLAHLTSMARDSGCHLVQLTTNKARAGAHRFYARLGFENSHEGFKLEL